MYVLTVLVAKFRFVSPNFLTKFRRKEISFNAETEKFLFGNPRALPAKRLSEAVPLRSCQTEYSCLYNIWFYSFLHRIKIILPSAFDSDDTSYT
jgi:hypothetical protein